MVRWRGGGGGVFWGEGGKEEGKGEGEGVKMKYFRKRRRRSRIVNWPSRKPWVKVRVEEPGGGGGVSEVGRERWKGGKKEGGTDWWIGTWRRYGSWRIGWEIMVGWWLIG